jgi:hypothetical protein
MNKLRSLSTKAYYRTSQGQPPVSFDTLCQILTLEIELGRQDAFRRRLFALLKFNKLAKHKKIRHGSNQKNVKSPSVHNRGSHRDASL